LKNKIILKISVADPDPGSGSRVKKAPDSG